MSPVRSKRPTLKTISELSGFAVPTVSRALKGAPDIGKSTKETVQRIAREIGYVPNRAGVRLKTGKTNVISLVLSTEQDMLNHPARLISSFAGTLRDTNYHVIVTPFFPDEEPLKPVEYIVETGSADAIVLNQIKPEDERVAYLMERNFPFATHGRTKWSQSHPYFDFDNDQFGRHAVAELARRGRENLALIAPPPDQNYGREMIAAALDAAPHQNVAMTHIDSVVSDGASQKIRETVALYLDTNPKTDAIICASTASAMASVAAAEATGRRIGHDLDIFAKEVAPFLNLFRPGILSIREDTGRAGKFLAKAAMQAINRPDLAPLQALDFSAPPE